MSDYTRDDALAFINAIRLQLEGKVGFKWMTQRLTLLSDYVESVADQNESLNAFLDSRGMRSDFETRNESA